LTTLSIIVPVYNEGPVIEQVVRELTEEIVDRFDGGEVELVVVDDCSTDETGEILQRLANEIDALRVVVQPHNRGHGPAVLRAVEESTGPWLFHVDSDHQCLPGEFWSLWELRDDADLVLGARRPRRDPRLRLALAFIESIVVSTLAGRFLHDPNVPFKLFRRTVIDDLRPAMGYAPFAPSIMLSIGSVRRAWRVVQVPVSHLPRPHGRSTLAGLRVAGAFGRAGLETVAFRRRLNKMAPR
jgi:glycosyltransferase involved in cell wall biosynthesis